MSDEVAADEWRTKLQEIITLIPPPSIQPLPQEHRFDLSKYKNRLDLTPAEAWQKCAEVIKQCDADVCKAYREEIDTLLVFAGLFSAVVTAFTIESYQWLQDDPNDAIVELLSQIAQPANQTKMSPAPAGLSDAASARINAYWFLSLTLSLSAGLIAILCKQWVREFERHSNQSHDQFISVRQTKLEGFEGWRVGSAVAAVPLLLQSALGLFALGLIELLWNLHVAVAIVVLFPAVVALGFYTATTVLPALQVFGPFTKTRELSQCPYKSPQAMLTLHGLILLSTYIPHWWLYFRNEIMGRHARRAYRKCFIFLRRVRTYWQVASLPYQQPGSRTELNAPEATEGGHGMYSRVSRSWCTFWCLLLRPWRYNEDVFHSDWKAHWSWVNSCFRWRRQQQRPHTQQSDGDDRYVHFRLTYGSKALESWTSLDRHFTQCKDAAYKLRLRRIDVHVRKRFPPAACFRGLVWLHRHTDQPGLPLWTWLVLWDIATGIPERITWNWLSVVHLDHGIQHLMPDGWYMGEVASVEARPILYGPPIKLKPALVAELFIQLLPGLKSESAGRIWAWVTRKLGTGHDIWHAGLHAILAHSLVDPEWRSVSAFRPLIGSMVAVNREGLISLSQPELAGIVAVLLREQDVDPTHRWSNYERNLLDVCLQSLAADEGSESRSLGLTPVFSALAYALDQRLELAQGSRALAFIPPSLDHQSIQAIYFELLSSYVGDGLDAAKERLAQQLRYQPKSRPGSDTGSSGSANRDDAAPGDPARTQPNLATTTPAHPTTPEIAGSADNPCQGAGADPVSPEDAIGSSPGITHSTA